ncbi:MAG: trypsin-like peptidase domain-containing protein [Verrucomicrobia bacterium]|nr:trypsin-like peptidase domain-containing protein [Verrucomicrobiota bacterium]
MTPPRSRRVNLAAGGVLWWALASAGFGALGQEIAKVSVEETSLSVAAKPSPGKLFKLPGAFRKETPTSVDDLKSMQRHIQDLVSRVSSAVVAVRVGSASGSGVVISEDGLVLSAAHVCVRPSLDVTFIFPDGKTARGKTLGTNHEIDGGLMQITDAGHWPHIQMGDLDQARLGDWVLSFGHPGGFDPYRSIVVRLGRIIRLARGVVQTDCTLMAGDSGGPLFDMHGRVIGIHSRISDSTAANFHVPITTYHETWERLARSENWGDGRPAPQPWVGAWGLDHPEGFRVELVNRNGPAEKAGVRVGDIVRCVNGQDCAGFESFKKHVARTKLGELVKLAIQRDGLDMALLVTIEQRPDWLGPATP